MTRFSAGCPLSKGQRVAKTGATPDSGARFRVPRDDSRTRFRVRGATWSARARVFATNRQRGQVMAEQEMKAANETYAGFISLFKVGTILTVIVAAFVVLLIS